MLNVFIIKGVSFFSNYSCDIYERMIRLKSHQNNNDRKKLNQKKKFKRKIRDKGIQIGKDL